MFSSELTFWKYRPLVILTVLCIVLCIVIVGYYCSNAETQQPCAAGYYCPERSSSPVPCPAGHYCGAPECNATIPGKSPYHVTIQSQHVHLCNDMRYPNWIGHVNVGITSIVLEIPNDAHAQHSVKSDWLFNTQSRFLQVDWLILEDNEKTTLNIKMPYRIPIWCQQMSTL